MKPLHRIYKSALSLFKTTHFTQDNHPPLQVHHISVPFRPDEIYDVKIERSVLKTLKKLPLPLVIKLQAWIDDIGHRGLSEVRKIPGYHNEPLQGKRTSQRSLS